MKKKIIFIGGTAYSGSTMFDMILGNDPKGFSTGEYRGFFKPRRKRHLKFLFISKEAENLWDKIKKNGLGNIYNTIFSEYPEIEFIVDSSKDPFLIKQMERIAKKEGYNTKHVLLWKYPEDFAYSCYKRKCYNKWRIMWKRLHRIYFSLFTDFIIVDYSQLVKDKNYLKSICEKLEIPFFENKHEFWNKKSFALGGNRSAKMHLFEQNSEGYKKTANSLVKDKIDLDEGINRKHKKIYYERDPDFFNQTNVEQEILSDKEVIEIKKILEKENIISENGIREIRSRLGYNKFYIFNRFIINQLKRKIAIIGMCFYKIIYNNK